MAYTPLVVADLAPNKPARGTSFALRVHTNLENHEALIAGATPARSLGGSRYIPNEPTFDLCGGLRGKHAGVGPSDVVDYRDVEIDGDANEGGVGLTWRARVNCRVDRSGVAITPQIYNVTTATVEATGIGCSATKLDYTGTNQKQTLAFTPDAGVNTYRLRYTLNNCSGQTWLDGIVEAVLT